MTLNKKSNWGGVSYESPSVKTPDIQSEGVLCESGKYDSAFYGYDPANELGEI